MSAFGGPGGMQASSKPTPPQRGSFPLDHDGECKHVMSAYLACMKKAGGVNDSSCRSLAKSYLACRMDRNLMAKDDFKNLGFSELSGDAARHRVHAPSPEKGTKGELEW